MAHHNSTDDFEIYPIKSTDPKPCIVSEDVILMEYDTGKKYIMRDGVWKTYIGNIIGDDIAITGTVGISGGTISIDNEPNVKVVSETLTKSDATVVNLADSYYKDEQITGTIGDSTLRQGNMFTAGYLASSVATNGLVILHIKSGTKPLYLTYEIIGTGLTEYSGYINPTITANGTQITPFKRNMITEYTGSATVYSSPTYSNIGTIIVNRFLGTSGNPFNKTGGADSSQYVILPSNSSIFLVGKNVSSSAQDRLGIYANWFEINMEL